MYNSYLGNNQFQNQYYPGFQQNYGSFQNMQMQQKPQQVQQNTQASSPYQDIPFRDVRFGTLEEIKAHMVFPMTSVLFIDRQKREAYVKSANSLGESALETFKFSNIEKNPSQVVSTETDPKELKTSANLDNFLTKEDLKPFITQEEAKFFVTKQDIDALYKKLEQLQKKIDISEILKGDNKNGKQ